MRVAVKAVACMAVLWFLAAAQPAEAVFQITKIRFMGSLAQDPKNWLFFKGAPIRIGWQIIPGTGKETMTIELLRANEDLVSVIATGLTNKFANMGQGNTSYWYNEFEWVPGPNDVKCFYKFRVSTADKKLSITSAPFDIYPALQFVKNGVRSYARLDSPQGGETYFLNRNLDIKWTAMSKQQYWPSRMIDLKLMANDNGNIIPVGDIAHVGIGLTGCQIFGTYSWKVGSLLTVVNPGKKPDGKNGIKYRVRLSGDTSSYDSEDFTIGNLAVQGVHIPKEWKAK